MAELADQLDRMVVEAASPDTKIRATSVGRANSLEFAFSPGAYTRYDEDVLAHQLARLLAIAYVQYVHTWRRLVNTAFGRSPNDDGDTSDLRGQRYQRGLEQIVATGTCDGEWLQVTTRCLVNWRFIIAPGSLVHRTEPEFVASMKAAISRVLDSYNAQVFRLKDDIYDLGYTEDMRRAVGLARKGTGGSPR